MKNSNYNPIDLVVCEGYTERDYISELARTFRVHAHIIKANGTDPESIVNTAKTKSKEIKYDSVFCVFDRDNDRALGHGIELCVQKKFIPIISNPCLEVWFLLHFKFRDTGFGNPENVQKALKAITGLSKYRDGVHAFESTISLLERAYKNAYKLASKQDHNPKRDPFTAMHWLVDRFRSLKKQQNYFGR